MLLSPVTPLLVVLHWLRIPQHIQYKLCYWSTSTYTGPQCTELPAERHLLGRECGITASPALRVIGRSHRARDATFNNGRPRLRRRSTARLEQSAERDPSQPISSHL